ncbi:MAG: hypothetical protein CL868_19835 [Cytophagaceae bacterium]|nr:hypothetical protein [Cytophagaceae bacterium]|tara:strand:+ start:1323 stop:2252 length:930 start_codon:yes stop_codon:yes gene_type:complete
MMYKDQNMRFDQLKEMILELAKGNFAHRIAIESRHHDIFQDLSMMLNMLAEELSDLFIHPGAYGDKNMVDPYVFVMDSNYKIKGINKKFTKLFKKPSTRLIGKSITKYTTSDSAANLKNQLTLNFRNAIVDSPIKIRIDFKVKPNVLLECWGYLHLVGSENGKLFFFRGLPATERKIEKGMNLESTSNPNSRYKTIQLQIDILRLRRVHQFILDNLNQTLPPIPVIARQFNLNEFKLKKGFKETFKNTIFKLHLEKRLEMAMVMIKNTPTSLKVIATEFGFKNYSHFSQAFKKHYGKKPSYFKNNKDFF